MRSRARLVTHAEERHSGRWFASRFRLAVRARFRAMGKATFDGLQKERLAPDAPVLPRSRGPQRSWGDRSSGERLLLSARDEAALGRLPVPLGLQISSSAQWMTASAISTDRSCSCAFSGATNGGYRVTMANVVKSSACMTSSGILSPVVSNSDPTCARSCTHGIPIPR